MCRYVQLFLLMFFILMSFYEIRNINSDLDMCRKELMTLEWEAENERK